MNITFYSLSDVPDDLRNYFNMEAYARDMMQDYVEADGHYFFAHW